MNARALLATWPARRARAARGFLAWGWLLPAYLPLAMQIGRGMFHTTLAAYFFWSICAWPQLRLRRQRLFVALLSLLVLAYFASVPLAENSAHAFKIWATTCVYLSAGLITLGVLERCPAELPRLLRTLATAALLTVLVSYLEWGALAATHEHVERRLALRAVDLPLLLPFLVAGALAWGRRRKLADAWMLAASCGVVALFVIAADERSVMFGLLVALSGLGVLHAGWRHGMLMAGALIAVLLFANALKPDTPTPGDPFSFAALDHLLSLRLTLWSQALAHPPDNAWLGVGMGNAQYALDVMNLNGQLTVRHLHNLWLDAWFETGWLGVAALASLLVASALRVTYAWPRLDAAQRQQVALFLIAALAVGTQSQFSISYSSREFCIYGLGCVAVLWHLAGQARRR